MDTSQASLTTECQSSDNITQKEAELKEIQAQVESYNQMVKQLTTQREMAVKKLGEMNTQIDELNKRLEIEKLQVETKENELKTKRTTLQSLKNEELELKKNFDSHEKEIGEKTQELANVQLNETQMKNKLTELQEFLKMTNEAIDDIEKAINIKDTIKLSAMCNQFLTPPTLSINNSKLTSNNNFINMNKSKQGGFDDLTFDPFKDQDPFEGDDPFDLAVKEVPALPDDDPFNPSSSNTLSQYDPFAPSA